MDHKIEQRVRMMSAASNNNNRFVVELSVSGTMIVSAEVLFRFDSGRAS